MGFYLLVGQHGQILAGLAQSVDCELVHPENSG